MRLETTYRLLDDNDRVTSTFVSRSINPVNEAKALYEALLEKSARLPKVRIALKKPVKATAITQFSTEAEKPKVKISVLNQQCAANIAALIRQSERYNGDKLQITSRHIQYLSVAAQMGEKTSTKEFYELLGLAGLNTAKQAGCTYAIAFIRKGWAQEVLNPTYDKKCRHFIITPLGREILAKADQI